MGCATKILGHGGQHLFLGTPSPRFVRLYDKSEPFVSSGEIALLQCWRGVYSCSSPQHSYGNMGYTVCHSIN